MTDEPIYEQISLFDPDGLFGKTYPDRCLPAKKKAQTSQPSLKSSAKSQKGMPLFLYLTEDGPTQDASAVSEMTGLRFPLPGDYTMRSFGEQPSMLMDECSYPELPSGVSVSRLSQILEDSPHQRYSLSKKACLGILKRAGRRGKKLPEELEKALTAQAGLSKLGGGVERDSNGRQAGKGALVQEEMSGTIGVAQDQTLIRAYRKTAHPTTADGAQGYEQTDTSDTLNAYGSTEARTPTVVAKEPILLESNQNHATIQQGGVSTTLPASMGLGGGYVPMVAEQKSVVFGISPYESNAMKSANPNSGIYKAETSRTLDLNGGNPACNQGGLAVVCIGNGQQDIASHISHELCQTLNTMHDPMAILEAPTDESGSDGEK